MKIVKSFQGKKEVFDSETVNRDPFRGDIQNLEPLQDNIDSTIWDFLEKQFVKDHPIFENFTQAYFYKLDEN